MIVQMGHGNTKRYLSPGPISTYILCCKSCDLCDHFFHAFFYICTYFQFHTRFPPTPFLKQRTYNKSTWNYK